MKNSVNCELPFARTFSKLFQTIKFSKSPNLTMGQPLNPENEN
jgi:hypothetical protein